MVPQLGQRREVAELENDRRRVVVRRRERWWMRLAILDERQRLGFMGGA